MGFENATTIAGLNELWPLGTDPRSEGDDHLREIKKALKTEFPKGGVTNTAQARNRVVNGAMQISQENVDNAGTTSSYYPADQWLSSLITTGAAGFRRWTATTSPKGSKYRIRTTINTADASLTTTEQCRYMTRIEGIRTVDFQWGTAQAKQVILRFGWNSPAGTYTVGLGNSDGTRSYIASFTITVGQAGTDTEQVLVIPGDTTGTWLTDTGIGVFISFCVASGPSLVGVAGWQAGNFVSVSGATNGLATLSAVFELFDVGLYLDAGATGLAPPWQMPDEAQELQACLRYWQLHSQVMFWGNVTSGSAYYSRSQAIVPMRTGPSFSGVNNSATNFPATVGTLTGGTAIATETRTANTTGPASFSTNITANARM